MSGQQLTVSVAELTSLNQTIPNFLAQGVTVDNLSSSWLFLNELGRWVPPWTVNWSAPLPGSKNAIASWNTPAGVTVPNSGTGKATFVYTDYTVPFSPGVVVTQAVPQGAASPATVQIQPPPNLSISPWTFGNPLNAGGHVTVVAGVAGQKIYVYGFGWSFTPVGGAAGTSIARLEDTTAAIVLDSGGLNNEAVNPPASPLYERALSLPGIVALPVGAGLRITNDAGSANPLFAAAVAYYLQF